MSWRRLLLLIGQLAGDESSALRRSLDGENHGWTFDRILLTRVLYGVEVGNWYYASAHTDKGHPKPSAPEPVLPPWEAAAQRPPAGAVTGRSARARGKFGGVAKSIDEMKKWLGW